MIRPNTWRIITAMQHTQSIGDRAVMHLPRKPVRQLMLFSNAKPTIPMTQRACPYPTPFGFVNMIPKSILNRAARSVKMASNSSTPERAILRIAIGRSEHHITLLTSKRWQSLCDRVFSHNARARTVDLIRVLLGRTKGFAAEQALLCGKIREHIKPPFDVSRRRVLEHRDGFVMPNHTMSSQVSLWL